MQPAGRPTTSGRTTTATVERVPATRTDRLMRCIALAGLAVLVLGVLAFCASTAWSVIEYKLYVAGGAVGPESPSPGVLVAVTTALALLVTGPAVSLAAVIALLVRSRRASPGR